MSFPASGGMVIDNRHGLVVSTCYGQATGTAEREAAVKMIKAIKRKQTAKTKRRTLGADKAYDTNDFVEQLRQLKVTLHLAQNTTNGRASAIDQRTTRHPGYAISQWKRKIVEEVFGWLKTVALMRKTRHKGLLLNRSRSDLVQVVFTRQWNASNFPSGVYFYRLQAGDFSETKKLALIR